MNHNLWPWTSNWKHLLSSSGFSLPIHQVRYAVYRAFYCQTQDGLIVWKRKSLKQDTWSSHDKSHTQTIPSLRKPHPLPFSVSISISFLDPGRGIIEYGLYKHRINWANNQLSYRKMQALLLLLWILQSHMSRNIALANNNFFTSYNHSFNHLQPR